VRFRPLDVKEQLVRQATYDLTAFSPDLGFELALGGLDAFLRHAGEDARAVQETRTTAISSGVDLPLGLAVNGTYSRSRSTRILASTGGPIQTEALQREWPSGAVRWSYLIRRGPVSSLGAGLTIRNSPRLMEPEPEGAARVARIPGHPTFR
jgi:hypothetical protein